MPLGIARSGSTGLLLALAATWMAPPEESRARSDAVRPGVYPATPAVVDVTKAPYSARGGGIADDTAALQSALDENVGRHRLIYFPPGTYLVRSTPTWPKKWGNAKRTAALSETVESLRASEERTRSILENMADAVVIVDDAGIIRESNPAAWRIFDCEEHGLSGRAISTLVAGPDRPGLDACLALARPGDDGPAVGVVRHVTGLRGDGTAFPMELSIGAFDFRGRRAAAAVIRDLAPKKAAEEEMRRRLEIQEQLAMVAETVPGVICSFLMRPDGAVSMPFATRAAEDL